VVVVVLPDWSRSVLQYTTVSRQQAGDNNVVDIIEGETQTFTCTTDSSRPAAWIQWYIGGQNVTNQAAPQPPQQDGDKFISSSSLAISWSDCHCCHWCCNIYINNYVKRLYLGRIMRCALLTVLA
jgi:hypothetical protein